MIDPCFCECHGSPDGPCGKIEDCELCKPSAALSHVARVIQEELDAVPGADAPPLPERIAIALGAADLLWRASEQEELTKMREALEWYATARVITPHPMYQRWWGWPDDGHYARVVLGKEKPVIVRESSCA